MKIAHLILAHKDPEQLARLLDRLQHHDADVYIHLDRKTKIAPFLKVIDREQVFTIKKRIRVYWGSYSIVQATLNSFKQILAAQKGYDYINLISVHDYPIKTTEEIHQFFADNPDRIFMEYLNEDSEWWKKVKTRVTQYHLTSYNFPGCYTLQGIINRLLPDRQAPQSLSFVGRSQWLTITEESARYLIHYLRENPKVRRFFRLSWGADEVALQTILYNSYLNKKITNNNLRYMIWEEGKDSPKTLGMDEAHKLINSPALYARKFDRANASEVLDYIDKHLTTMPEPAVYA